MTFVGLIFFFPETMWHRVHPKEFAEQQRERSTSHDKGAAHEIEGIDTERSPEGQVDIGIVDDRSLPTLTGVDLYLGKGYPSKKQFMPFTPHKNALRALAWDFWIPWRLFALPIVEFAAFVVSWSASSFLTINLTQSQNFAAPPYNFSSQSIGFMNFALLAGALIGLVTNGRLSDWIAARATKKNRGVREPEMRLPTLIPYVIIMLIGNFVVAFGYQQKWDWKVRFSLFVTLIARLTFQFVQPIVIIGYTCAGIQVAAIPAIASTYAIDSYKPVAGSIFVAITVNKNVWGYGFSKFITPWSIKSGFVPPIMLNMSLIFLWCSFGIVFYIFGKRFRMWSRNSSVHEM
jgi:hypothetical protein